MRKGNHSVLAFVGEIGFGAVGRVKGIGLDHDKCKKRRYKHNSYYELTIKTVQAVNKETLRCRLIQLHIPLERNIKIQINTITYIQNS